jgi:hypothetical protein
MTTRARWFARMLCTVVPALAVAGMASVASAQGPVCVRLDHGVPPPELLRLVVTNPGPGFLSIVGQRDPLPTDGVRGVVSGGGVVAGSVLEISLHETGIGTVPLPAGVTSFLATGSIHIRLDTTTLAGTFKSFETEVTATGNTATEHFDGTATVVTCPPGG